MSLADKEKQSIGAFVLDYPTLEVTLNDKEEYLSTESQQENMMT